MTDDLFVAIGNCVLRIRKSDGSEVWRTPLQGRLSGGLITLAVESDAIYASAKGQLYRLHPDTGDILWESELPKLGRGPVLISTVDNDSSS